MKNGFNTIRKYCRNKRTKPLILLAVIIGLKNHQQKKVNQEHQNMDFAWNIDDLHTRELLNYVTVAGEFDNKWQRGIHQATGINIDSDLPHTKNIFLRAKNYPSIELKRSAVQKMRNEAGSPVLIHTDFEGGYAHNFDAITQEEIAKFQVPQEIIKLREEEASLHAGNLSAFPSAGFIGKKYKDIFYSGDHEKRLAFIIMVQNYGKSIRKIMEYIGVDVVFGPGVDIVEKFDARGPKQNIAADDRSFGENFIIAQDMISAFIDGFQSHAANIVLVPKHFAGIGKSGNPHEQIDTSAMNRDDGTIAIFKNIINGENPFLDDQYLDKCLGVAKAGKSNGAYIKILLMNKKFVRYLKNNKRDLSAGDYVSAGMTTHVSGDKRVLGSSRTITFSAHILHTLKNEIGQKHPLKDGLVFSDDLRMEGASQAIKNLGIPNTEANKIILALSAGHDIVLHTEAPGWEFGYTVDDMLDEVAKLIDDGVDLDQNGKPDITREQLQEKAQKTMNLMVKKGMLLSPERGHYQIKDGTYVDPSIKKVLMDSWLSNQGLLTGSSRDDYEKEGNSFAQMMQKKGKNLRECIAHNFPNALYKYLTAHEEYQSALQAGKKLIIVDKSASTMFVYSVDGKKLLEQHAIGEGKGTNALDFTHDRKIFGDEKTPVGYYMIVDKLMGEKLYDEFDKNDIDKKGRYGGKNGGMLKLIGPRTPWVAVHGAVEKQTGPSSSACIRVIDESELAGTTKITEQKLINHMAQTIPVGSYVIITN